MVDCLRRFARGGEAKRTDGQDARATILSGALPGGEKDHGRRTGRSALPFLGAEQTGRGGARRSGGEAGRQVDGYELMVDCLRRFFGGRSKTKQTGRMPVPLFYPALFRPGSAAPSQPAAFGG